MAKVFARCQTQQHCYSRNHIYNNLERRVACHFARWSHYFCYDTKWFHIKIKMWKQLWVYLSEALATRRNIANDPHEGCDPTLETTVPIKNI